MVTTESVPIPHSILESEEIELSKLLEETEKDMVEVKRSLFVSHFRESCLSFYKIE